MSMTSCGECGHEISTKAEACPKCGAVVPKARVWPWVIGAPVAVIAVMAIYGSTIPDYEHDARERRQICEKISPAWDRSSCDRVYQLELADGKAKAAK